MASTDARLSPAGRAVLIPLSWFVVEVVVWSIGYTSYDLATGQFIPGDVIGGLFPAIVFFFYFGWATILGGYLAWFSTHRFGLWLRLPGCLVLTAPPMLFWVHDTPVRQVTIQAVAQAGYWLVAVVITGGPPVGAKRTDFGTADR